MPFKKPHQTADTKTPDNIKWDSDKTRCVIKPKGLNIIWGSDPRYWKLTNEGNAELIQVSWLEVSGKLVDNVERGKSYAVKFDVEVNPNGFGWANTEVLVMAKIGKKGQYQYKTVQLTNGRGVTIPEDELVVRVPSDETDLELHFGLYEVWSGKWKGGLVIKQAQVIKKS